MTEKPVVNFEEEKIPLRRVLQLLLGFAFRIAPGRSAAYLGLTVLIQLAFAFNALVMKYIVDAVIARDLREALVWVAVTAGVISTGQLLGLGSTVLRLRVGEEVQLRLDEELMALSTDLPGLEHHERPEFADQLARLREQRSRLIGALGFLVAMASIIISAIATGGLLLSVHPLLALFPVAALLSLRLEGISERRRQAAWAATAERGRITRHLFDLGTTPGPAKELRVFGTGEELRRRHGQISNEVRAEIDRENRRAAGLRGIGWILFAVSFGIALVFVVRQVLSGQSTPGDVMLFLTLGARVNSLVADLAGQVRNTNQNVDIVRRYLWFSDYAKRLGLHPGEAKFPDRLSDGIRLESVAFSYPGTESPVLTNVNLHLPAGATVALVGDNGAGKTTLVKLLCGFYRPDAGRIIVDGVALDAFDPKDVRRRMSAGFQDFVKFEFRARQTVGLGEVSLLDDPAAVDAALERAGATDVKADLPGGLDTQLGRSFPEGAELSGGQWQKLALSRTMMRETPLLLVLDEPTASLDAETEHALFQRYSGAAERAQASDGAITVLVSHRFSTVRMADLIAVVADGTVLEVGSHQELMALGGRYAELYELQAASYRR